MIPSNRVYSINEAYYRSLPAGYRRWLDWTKENDYKLRFHGALVADFHRLLIDGGVFAYPETASYPNGKLRLMYEANPIAFLAEQAGGKATDGQLPIMSKQPQALHERTPLLVGAAAAVEQVQDFISDTKNGLE